MEIVEGMNNKGLIVDLTLSEVEEFAIETSERELYLGGKGLGIKFLYDNLDLSVDPLAPENIVAFYAGVMLGTGAPNSGRFAAMTKSPLTKILTSSSSGGPFGLALKRAGYDALIIKGKAKKPVYIKIKNDDVQILNAEELWGKDTVETEEGLKAANTGIMTIGPAGENKVLYANVASGGRFFGRGGIGAVLGSKNLKAVVASGDKRIRPKNKEKFDKVKKKAQKTIEKDELSSTFYRTYGTNTNINLSNKFGILPVRNFKKGSSDRAKEISGEYIFEKYQTKKRSCRSCTIQCGHKFVINEKTVSVPEYETNALFGSNLEIYDIEFIAEVNELCGELGVDTISTAVTIAYVMEATEKKLMESEVKFGSKEGIKELIRLIANREGVGADIANGTRWLSEKYGGKEYAMQVKGLELPAYDPRGSWGQGLSYSVANRGGCHLSAGIFVGEKYIGQLNAEETKGKAEFVIFLEDITSVVNSLQICAFSSFSFLVEPFIVRHTPKIIMRVLTKYIPKVALLFMGTSLYSELYESTTGIKMKPKKLLKAGERMHVLERYMNTIMGVGRKDDKLPNRFMKEVREDDPKKYTVPLSKMIDKYYQKRGYDKNGVPTIKKLEELEIKPY